MCTCSFLFIYLFAACRGLVRLGIKQGAVSTRSCLLIHTIQVLHPACTLENALQVLCAQTRECAPGPVCTDSRMCSRHRLENALQFLCAQTRECAPVPVCTDSRMPCAAGSACVDSRMCCSIHLLLTDKFHFQLVYSSHGSWTG